MELCAVRVQYLFPVSQISLQAEGQAEIAVASGVDKTPFQRGRHDRITGREWRLDHW